VRRGLCFGAVGASGVAVNTGTLLAPAALGFDGLSWPLWLAAELTTEPVKGFETRIARNY
jgi:hypothetical protein